MTLSATDKVAVALASGEELTAKQIAARYCVANPYQTVYQLRSEGFCVYLNKRVNSKGHTTRKYRLGTPRASAGGSRLV